MRFRSFTRMKLSPTDLDRAAPRAFAKAAKKRPVDHHQAGLRDLVQTYGLNTEATCDWNESPWTAPISVSASQPLKTGKLPGPFAVGAKYQTEGRSEIRALSSRHAFPPRANLRPRATVRVPRTNALSYHP